MKEIAYCTVCYEDIKKGETVCLDCYMNGEAELQKYYAEFDKEREKRTKPIKGGINPDGTQRYSCPTCGLLWWEEKDIPDKCQCGTDIEINRRDGNEQKQKSV